MKQEVRKNRGYKATDSDYYAAMKRAKKEKVSLSTLIEIFIMAYGTRTPFSIRIDVPVDIKSVSLADGRIIVTDKELRKSLSSSSFCKK